MNDERKNLKLMKDCSNYHRWISHEIKPFIKGRCLEVGPGEGSITQFLYRKDYWGLDIDAVYVNKLNKRFGRGFRVGDISDSVYFKPGTFDTILMINILEHVSDDVGALDNCNVLLSDNGVLFGLFPAHEWLYGSIDKADGHYRRYSRANLIAKFERSGFKVRTCTSFNFFGLLGWLWHSKVKQLKTHNKTELNMFNQLVPFLSKIDNYTPTGLSWFVIAEKTQNYWYEGKWWTETQLHKEISTIKYLQRTNQILEMIPKQKKVLDIGCGIGAVTQRIARRSKKVTAIDIQANNIKIAKKFCKHKNITYKVLAAEKTKGKYDVVILNEVIEHLKNPFEMLKTIHKILPKEGTLIITTPNAVSPTNIAINYVKGIKELGDVPGTEAEHYYLWDTRCLLRLLKLAGFKYVKHKFTKHSIVMMVKKDGKA